MYIIAILLYIIVLMCIIDTFWCEQALSRAFKNN